MKRAWRVFLALTLNSPLVSVLLALFYVLAFGLSLTADSAHAGLGVAALCILPTAGFIAMASDRVIRYSAVAGTLGIPRHIQAVLAAQVACLVVFIGTPLLAALRPGDHRLACIALLCAAGAVGTLFPRHQSLVFFGGLSVALLNGAGNGIVSRLISSPWVLFAVIPASLYSFQYWLTLPRTVEERARLQATSLADKRHEAIGARAERRSADLELPELGTAFVTEGGPSFRGLGVGLAFGTRINWRLIALAVGLGCAVIAVRRLTAGLPAARFAYLIVAIAAVWLLAMRISTLYVGWTTRSSEQEVLKLTPRWPQGRAFKRLVITTLVRLQVGTWAAMTAITCAVWLPAWIGPSTVAAGAAIVGAGSSAASAAVLVASVRRAHKQMQWINIAIMLCCAVGAALLAFAASLSPWVLALGCTLILAPLILAFVAFSMRDIRFPGLRVTRRRQ